MVVTLTNLKQVTRPIYAYSYRITFDDGLSTTIHIVRYQRSHIKPRVVAFDRQTNLHTWCAQNNVAEALTGGFYLKTSNQILGELWINGVKLQTINCDAPWDQVRACIAIKKSNSLEIAARNALPSQPSSDLLQAGPLLVSNSANCIAQGGDPEGFTAAARQFDSDISACRHPRSALGYNDQFIWSFVCDGRSDQDAGMTLNELAHTLLTIGVTDAINLDGGASASQISGGHIQNFPRTDSEYLPFGRPIMNAIVFESC